MVENIFNSIKNSFIELSQKIDSLTSMVAEISMHVDKMMGDFANALDGVTNSLNSVLNIKDIQTLKDSLHKIVETFQNQLEPQQIRDLLTDLSNSINDLKEKHIVNEK
ncbi:MAG: hypothetical protein ACTSRS_00795 [Candidatus Helarchaeota archaeon]